MKMDDRDKVLEANLTFYRAFEDLNLAAMEKIWVRESYIQCFHPGWGILRGWEKVMTSWRRIFENTAEIHFMVTEVQAEVRDSLAWVTLYENITSRVGEEMMGGTVLTTNVFEKREGNWLMIHHHGSTVVPQPMQADPGTIH